MEATDVAISTGRRPWAEIHADFTKRIPARLIEQRTQAGATIDYVPWTYLMKLLHHYTNGHVNITNTPGQVVSETCVVSRWDKVQKAKVPTTVEVRSWVVSVRIEVDALDTKVVVDGEGEAPLAGDRYGSFATNAWAQAFRRACAKLGLGLDMWIKEDNA
jgi:hypothetical protein